MYHHQIAPGSADAKIKPEIYKYAKYKSLVPYFSGLLNNAANGTANNNITIEVDIKSFFSGIKPSLKRNFP
jgi:hypothetical protein